MNYQETIEYLFEALPMFQKIGGAAFNKDLGKTIQLLKCLGNPHKRFKSIHVAGTNGKGSVSSMLSAIYQSAGYKTGLYTSPHLKEFTERIRVNGVEISKDNVVAFVEARKSLIEDIKPSFFELTVAMAFDTFARQNIDIAIVEVGMGGRLDSTNVITPELSIITNISFDHQQYLGDTLEEIAGEKAGIIKPKIPVLISEHVPETKMVFNKIASENNSPLFFADEELILKNIHTGDFIEFDSEYIKSGLKLRNLKCGLAGGYQNSNIKAVLSAVEILNPTFKVSEKAIREGLKDVVSLSGIKGRWQVLSKDPLVICDTGHNEAGIKNILQQIKNTKFSKLHIVFGAVKDKDIRGILSLLPKNANYYFCQPTIPRALQATELCEIAKEFGLIGPSFKSVDEALQNAMSEADPNDLIFVGGSTFVVGDLNRL